MADLTSDELYALEVRKIALEETRETNRAREAAKTRAPEARNKVNLALISVVSALVGAAASLGAAYVTGGFDVQKAEVSNQGQFDLAKQKFANDLIKDALSEGSDQERAQRLKFMVDIGLFSDQLQPDRIREYAEAETKRIEEGGGEGESLLPRTLGADPKPVAFFFAGGTPALDHFKSDGAIEVMRKYDALKTREGLALIIANLHFESAGFRLMVERGDYPARTLVRVFPRQYPTLAQAEADDGDAEKILNKAYGNRLGNTEPGDGWRYRGRGFIQVTGKANYHQIGEAIGVDLVANPDLAADPVVALEIALRYIVQRTRSEKTLMEWAHLDDARQLRRGISGGLHGIDDVLELQQQYLGAFAAPQFKSHPLVAALPD